MSRARFDLSFDLEVLSPLHIGAGVERAVARVTARRGDNTAPGVAAIQRDVDGKPYLPGSTLKGLLRRLAPAEVVEALFGSVSWRGALIAVGSTAFTPGRSGHLPYADTADLGDGVYVAGRTRIDPARGVAAASSLHHAEAVAPGARFHVVLALEARGANAEARCNAARAALLPLLALLAQPRGQAVGAGQADGDGRVRLLEATLKEQRRVLGADGSFAGQPRQLALPKAGPRSPTRRWVLRLHCPGPFAVLDPSHVRPQRTEDAVPMLAAQRRTAAQPELPGSSVAGALRARAAWLAARDAARQGNQPAADDPAAVFRRGEVPVHPVQRLFGATGFRALLAIEELSVAAGATSWGIHSVRIDRFSGGPMTGGLWGTETFLGTTARLVLGLHDRGGKASPTDQDRRLAEALVADLCRPGEVLMLGHGTTKGFGWFSVTQEPGNAA